MLPLLIIFSIFSVIEFQPNDVRVEYSHINDTEVSIILGISSLLEQQSITIKDESLIGSDGVQYPIELSITIKPTSAIDIAVTEMEPFAPSKIVRVEDMLCGSTTLNNPCMGRKTLCCVDLYKGVNYLKCQSPTEIRYKRYEWSDISSTIGFTIRVRGSEHNEYKMLSPNHNLIAQTGDLRLAFSFRADSSVEEALSALQGDTMLRTSDTESIDGLRVLLAGDTFTDTEDEWINKSSCYIETDREFNLVRDTIELSRIVGSEYSETLLDNIIHLVGDLDMIFYLTISVSK